MDALESHLAGQRRAEPVVVVEGGGDAEAVGVVILHSRNALLQHEADFPKLGALVHVFIQPSLTYWEVKFRHK